MTMLYDRSYFNHNRTTKAKMRKILSIRELVDTRKIYGATMTIWLRAIDTQFFGDFSCKSMIKELKSFSEPVCTNNIEMALVYIQLVIINKWLIKLLPLLQIEVLNYLRNQ